MSRRHSNSRDDSSIPPSSSIGEKRSAEDHEDSQSSKRVALDQHEGSPSIHDTPLGDDQVPPVVVRSIIPTKMVGAVIGKGGANVKSYRDETNTRITISESVPGLTERIMTVSGSVKGVAKAYSLIHSKLDESGETGAPPGGSRATLKILIPNSQIGSIIGKAGAKIKEIQERTAAKIVISEENLANSTERCTSMTGTSDSIYESLLMVLEILVENPEKGQTVPYRPASTRYTTNQPHYQAQAPYQPQYAEVAPAPAPPPTSDPNPNRSPGPNPHYFYQAVPVFNSGSAFPPTNHFTMSSQPASQQLYIPHELVGCIIGKGGSKINEIRQQSGSQIRIGELEAGSNERLVTITGTPESNQMALYLLYSRLQAERNRVPGS